MAVPYAEFVRGGVRTTVWTKAEYLDFLKGEGKSGEYLQAEIDIANQGPAASYVEQVTESFAGDTVKVATYIEAVQVAADRYDLINMMPSLQETTITNPLPASAVEYDLTWGAKFQSKWAKTPIAHLWEYVIGHNR